MTPHAFVDKWRNAELKERTASQSHFNDLCALLGVLDPLSADPTGEWFTFEKGASKTGGGEGWADVWRREHFAWEYKGPGKDLDRALQQLLRYARSLENPPLLIVSDMAVIRVHTNFTNTVAEVHEFGLDDLLDGDARDRLKKAFVDPDSFKPAKTRQMLTEDVAREFATLAQRLRDRGHEATAVAHFVVRCAFCMFAEDVELLPNKMFERLVVESRRNPDDFVALASDLFRLMSTGGRLGLERVAWFNGGLFDDDPATEGAALPLNRVDIDLLHAACKQHWSEIDPSILGTLFERGLDPDKRSQLGAHYTDRAKIELIVDPTIAGPLTAEWAAIRDRATAEVEAAETAAAAVRERAAAHGELKAEIRELEGALSRGRQADLFPDAPRQKLVRELDALATEVRAATARVRAARAAVRTARDDFMAKLRAFRVLDPACGSGNFLYVALKLLKDIEHRVNIDAEALGVPVVTPEVGPANVLGIEMNPFAAELARTSVWIGDIQWMRANGFAPSTNPVLKPLDTIECRDAVLGEGWERAAPSSVVPALSRDPASSSMGQGSGAPGQARGDEGGRRESTRARWPAADVIIGNPPFLGNKKMIGELGEDYTLALRKAWPEVPGGVDLVCYWFAAAWEMIVAGRTQRVGLVATNSIRGGANRKVLKQIVDGGRIFDAWSDEGWTVEGAAVRVSLVCFTRSKSLKAQLNGQRVDEIFENLTASSGLNLSAAVALKENVGVCFVGVILNGDFEIEAGQARMMLRAPKNVNARPNSDVLRPTLNGDDFNGQRPDKWVIDFGTSIAEEDAAFYELPFGWIERHVKEFRQRRDANNKHVVRSRPEREVWWRHARPRPRMRKALSGLETYIGTPMVSSYRTFGFLPHSVLPDQKLVVFAKDDFVTFGVLQCRFHEIWTRATCSWIGSGNDITYSNTAVFLTFPFPEGLTPDIPASVYADDPRARAIAAAAARLNELRENWLNPADLVLREPEVVAGYPDRLLPRDADAAKELKTRTLTNLYNARPQWLANAHAALDAAVADAYGWGADWRAGVLGDEEILTRLFALNQARAGVSG